MISTEKHISKNSHYYIYTPSTQALKTFFYPTSIGYFHYEAGYSLTRSSFDSFLLMTVKKGQCELIIDSKVMPVYENQIILLDCYKPHSYQTATGYEAEWLHFDGPLAREYYELLQQTLGNVFSLKTPYLFNKIFHNIYQLFHDKQPISEPMISQNITIILTEALLSHSLKSNYTKSTDTIQDIVAYINDHLSENMTLNDLAVRTALSPYYFTRLFKKKTGFTPHQYIITARINYAKYLLQNTDTSVKIIGFDTGFASESNFCTAFKKSEQMTPREYREKNRVHI